MKHHVHPKKSGAGETRLRQVLTHRTLLALRAEQVPYRVPDLRCPGLAARVATSGKITWDFSFRVSGKKVRRLSLGLFPEVSLDHARQRASELAIAARSGRDLIEEAHALRVEATLRLTIPDLIARYVQAKRRAGIRTVEDMDRRLRRALSPVIHLAIDEVRRRHIAMLLDEVAESGREREAEKRRQVIGAMFRWAIGRDLVDRDPTHGMPPYDPGTPRDRVLSSEEITSLFQWIPISGLPRNHSEILTLQLALGARCGEIAGMHSSELDLTNWTWRLPEARSKNGRARMVPLLGISRKILQSRAHLSGQLFQSKAGGSLTASHVGQAIIVRRQRCPIPHFTTHDLRRTFVSSSIDLGLPIEVIASIVGHDSGDRNTRTLFKHYVKTDMLERKRAALAIWNEALTALVGHDPLRILQSEKS
jgi:integrase